MLETAVATPNGTTKHIGVSSLDQYWFAGSKTGQEQYELGLLDNLGTSATADQAARGSNYGDVITDEEAINGGTQPIFSYIETGGPYTDDTSASDYITPPELNWAVWSSLIHGANGIIYFDHTFGGPAQSDDDMYDFYYQTVQPGQTVSMYTQVQNTDALVEQMAPVLNSPTALNYATVNTPGYENGVVDFGVQRHRGHGEGRERAVLCLRRYSRLDDANKYLRCLHACRQERDKRDRHRRKPHHRSEKRSIHRYVATAATVHIYEVNDGSGSSTGTGSSSGTGSTPPAIIAIADSPAIGDLSGGKVVTVTLAFSENVTVTGGAPTLTLNDGGTATMLAVREQVRSRSPILWWPDRTPPHLPRLPSICRAGSRSGMALATPPTSRSPA